MYTLVSTISLDNITNTDKKSINKAALIAEKSDFKSSLRLGACIRHSKGFILWG